MVRSIASQIAPDVYCLGPWGRTQTNAYLVRAGGTWTLVDAGWARDALRIERSARELLGPDEHPAAILLTHCHPDHAGAAGPLARAWGCRVWMHPAEQPIATGDLAAMQASAGPLEVAAAGLLRRHDRTRDAAVRGWVLSAGPR